MTSLRTFQTEIDEISHREVAKQRAHAAAERAKAEKEAKKPAVAKTHARKESTAAEAVEPQSPASTAPEPTAASNGDAAMTDVDEQLQVRGP